MPGPDRLEHICSSKPSNVSIVMLQGRSWDITLLVDRHQSRTVMIGIPYCPYCGDSLDVQNFTSASEIVGKAHCGCVYHAEQGIPCEHDLVLAGQSS